MLGAIIGDIVGSPYEFDENNIKTTNFPLFTDKSVFTDDTVMTVAVARALMDTYGADDDIIENALTMQMRALGRNYPGRGYGGMFQAWLLVDTAEAYNSFGNGSAMRVAAAGWLYRTLEETLHAAELTARVTHNHPEGIKGAQAVAAAIFLARLRLPKDDIRAYLSRAFGYDLTRTLKQIRPGYKMDET
ncbi:MAG: ADP-ribosylglycohydrolase family protein, partial [Clostridia bacterium]|nr:ADP-ribosylglycohydrolase family protein [Clostridia bacterium]